MVGRKWRRVWIQRWCLGRMECSTDTRAILHATPRPQLRMRSLRDGSGQRFTLCAGQSIPQWYPTRLSLFLCFPRLQPSVRQEDAHQLWTSPFRYVGQQQRLWFHHFYFICQRFSNTVPKLSKARLHSRCSSHYAQRVSRRRYQGTWDQRS